jgi:hypothetical protein
MKITFAQLIFLMCIVVFCLAMLYEHNNKTATRYVVIRDDDVMDDTPALRWYVNTIETNGATSTLAVIPGKLTQNGLEYLKSLDKRQFEFATHGYNHTGKEDQVVVMEKAYDKMTKMFGYSPMSIAPPYFNVPIGYTEKAKELGYHSLTNAGFGASKILDMPIYFYWEADWGRAPDWAITYNNLDTFKMWFDEWYNSTSKNAFVISVHHEPLFNNENARENFTISLDYLNQRGCVLLTEEEAYKEITT